MTHSRTFAQSFVQSIARKLMLALVILTALAVSISPSFGGRVQAQESTALLRFVHAVPGAGGVDIYIDSILAAQNVLFGTGTRFFTVEAGQRAVTITPNGQTAPIFSGAVPATADLGHTVIVQGSPSGVEVGLYEDELFPVRSGATRLTAIHAIKGAAPVDVLLVSGTTITPLIQGLTYGQPFGTLDIPASAGDLVVVPAGGTVDAAVLRAEKVSLVAGTYNTVLAVGAPSGEPAPKALLLTTPTQAENAAASALISFVHAATDAPEVDVYVNGTLIAPRLAFGAATPHVALPGGAQEVTLRAAGAAADSAPVGTVSAAVNAGFAATVIISGALDGLNIEAFPDRVNSIDTLKARVKVINVLDSESLSLALPSGESVAGAEGVDVAPTTGEARLKGGSLETALSLSLSGGTLTNVILTGRATEPTIIVNTTSLNERPGNLPMPGGAAVAVQATPTLAPLPTAESGGGSVFLPTAAPTVVPVPTTEAPIAVPTSNPDLVVVQPTANPLAFQPTPFGKTGWTGTVATDPGVNLKIREYPSQDARTLALVPSGDTLDVDGLRGPKVDENLPTPSEPTPTLSAEGVIIDDLWVFVEWRKPDGTITGWTKPQYLRLKNGKGINVFKVEDILTLPLIPEDKFGVVGSGSATPIATVADRVIATVTVNPGVNLQMRRLPGIDSESLTLLPAGAQLVAVGRTEVASQGGLIGEPQSLTWINAIFETESGRITGWVNSQFLVLTFKGRAFDIKELPLVTEPTPGGVVGSAPIVQPPVQAGLVATVDKVNPGANLQLRRTPSAQGESLGLIPSGAQIPVLGRNNTAEWLLVQYNGVEGWVNAFFVTVTKDGKRVNLFDDVKNVSEENDATVTPSPTPSATPAS